MDKTRERILEQIQKRRSLPPPEEREALRKAAGLSLRDVAEAMGVAATTVHFWETGKRNPNSKHLDDYIAALGAMAEAA